MSDAIRHIINACDPMAPATEEFYTDTSVARGSSSFVQHYLRTLANADRNTCELFSGHIGCGKSSELRKLYQALENEEHAENCPRVFPVYINADEYLNFYDVTPNDILLSIAAELGSALQERKDINLANNYLTKRVRGIWEGLTTDYVVDKVEINAGLASLKAILKPLPKDENAREIVQEALRPQASRISDELNFALVKALAELKHQAYTKGERTYSGIVVIVDSLERILHVKGCDNADDSWRELFVRNAELLRGVQAHVVYTVPLPLVRSIQDNLRGPYGKPASVLPMVTAERRNGSSYSPGRDCLRDLLSKRVGNAPLTGDGGVFTEEALDFLLQYCGGHPRHLLSFVVEAALNTDTFPIGIDAAKRSVVPTVRQFSPSIPHRYYEKMAQVELDPQHQIDNTDPDYRNMLEQNWVLEYVNAGDSDNPFETTGPWYAVHPIIRELPSYKAALMEKRTIKP